MFLEKLRSAFKTVSAKELRQDFPVLNQSATDASAKPVIYFDNATTCLMPRQVIDAMTGYYNTHPRRVDVAAVQQKVRDFVGADSRDQVIFAKSVGSAIHLLARNLDLSDADIIMTTDKEQNANLLPWLKLAKHETLFSESDNTFALEPFSRKMRQLKLSPSKRIRLLSMPYTSALDGVTNPVSEIIQIAAQYKTRVLLDCTHAALHQKIHFKKLNADYMVFAASNILGPSAMAVLVIKQDAQLIMDDDTQDPAQLLGLAAALEYINAIGPQSIHTYLVKLNRAATEKMAALGKVRIVGPLAAEKRAGTISFVLEGKSAQDVASMLQSNHAIITSAGKLGAPFWFNRANTPPYFKEGVVRVSFNFYNTMEEVEEFIKAISDISNL